MLTETTIYPLSTTLKRLIQSEAFAGIALISCTIISLILANSSLSSHYLAFWQTTVAGLSIEHWINDALMAIFFLLIGLELERELYTGELSSLKNALLPIFAALGGMAAPALIHFFFNAGSATQSGIGIPMATDIAFALGILALLGSRIPTSLKILVTAFAIIDDLGAIIIIAIFYGVFSFEMNKHSTLLCLFRCMAANIDQCFYYPFKCIHIIIPNHQAI